MVDQRIERGKATRERLVAAGRELFGERGYEATSIESILDVAGVARGALYHHFATKEELFDAVLEQVTAEMAAAVVEAGSGEPDVAASLHAGCAAFLEMALDPELQRICLIDAPAVVGWARWRELDERYSLGSLQAAFQALAADGRIRADQVDLFAHMVIASVTEAALMIIRSDDQQTALEQGKAAVNALLDGLIG